MGPVLTELLDTLAAAARGVEDETAATVVGRLLALADEHDDVLNRIDHRVNVLVATRRSAGQRLLREALEEWHSPEDRHRLLSQAHNAFTEALSQEVEPLRRSLAALHLAAICVAIDDDPHDVSATLREGHVQAAIAAINHPKVTAWPQQWTDPDMLTYVNGLADVRRAWGEPPDRAPHFFTLRTGAHPERDWQSWAARYARARGQGRDADRSELESAATSYGVDTVALRAALDAIDAGELRLDQFLDGWADSMT